MPAWLVYSIVYLVLVGANGVVAKLALRSVSWPVLMVSVAVMYALIIPYAASRGMLHATAATWQSVLPVVLTGVFTAGSLVALFLALERGNASQVVPITAGYPIVTVLLSIFLLSEPLSAVRLAGVLLIVVGAILVAR